MEPHLDPSLSALFGSRTRLLTMAVLANADEPLTGYRVAKVAGLPRTKVYPEIRKGVRAGLLVRDGPGYRMNDPDVKDLLRKRVRIRWYDEWNRARGTTGESVERELSRIRASLEGVRTFNPSNRIPKLAIRELRRDPEKNRILRRLGLRPSTRKE
jgi:hypothetical protein